VNGAFEAIKRVSLTRQPNLERLVVVIAGRVPGRVENRNGAFFR
jgi:hypothetical protein